MGVRQSMYLVLVKKEKNLRKRNHGSFNEIWIWNIQRNDKMRQKNEFGRYEEKKKNLSRKIMGFEKSMDFNNAKK